MRRTCGQSMSRQNAATRLPLFRIIASAITGTTLATPTTGASTTGSTSPVP